MYKMPNGTNNDEQNGDSGWEVKNLPKAHTCFNRFGSLNLNTNNLNISKIKDQSTTLRGHSDSYDPFIIVEMLIWLRKFMKHF